MAERRAGLGRGLGELFASTDPAEPPHPVDRHVIVDPAGGPAPEQRRADHHPTERSEARARRAGTPETERAEPDDRPTVDPSNGYYTELPPEAIHPNPRQPRTVFDPEALDDLVRSIREVGLLQPIVVRADGSDSWELVMGERRWRAAREAGLERVPAIVRQTGDDDMLRDALLENLHRVQLNPLEEAAAYQQMMDDFGCTQQELGARIQRSRSQVANTLRLLNLAPRVQRLVATGQLSAGHARALLGLPGSTDQEELADLVVSRGLSVRATEDLVAARVRGTDRDRRTSRPVDPRLLEKSSRLGEFLDTRVEITRGRRRGKIVVEFTTDDDLDRIMGLLSG